MLMMRLQRIGRRNEPHYRIVVIEKTQGPKSQKYVDIVGSYNPKLGQVTLDTEKAAEWIGNGVQPSDTVYNILVDKGVVEGRKKNVLPQKSPVVDHEAIAKAEEEAKAKAEAEAAEKAEAETAEAAPETFEASDEAEAETSAEEAPATEEEAEETPAEDTTEESTEEVAPEAEEETPAEESAEEKTEE
jgi:small subunit ribosomal protein S16